MVDELLRIITMGTQYEQLSIGSLMATMCIAVACGLAIYFVYRFFYRGLAYSENMGILLVMVSGITAFIILTIGSNLILSLGMVGALSIVRFRAAIKEPLDVGFIFWSIAAGLTSGARLYMVAIIGTVVVAIVFIAMTFFRKEKQNFLLILRFTPDEEQSVNGLLKDMRYKLKSKSLTKDVVELTVEVIIKRNKTEFMSQFNNADFISSVVLVEYSGDYT